MARTYHIDVLAFAAEADIKWVDNLLSRFTIPGVIGGRQGIARHITTDGVYHVVLVRLLAQGTGIPLAAAVPLAVALLSSAQNGAPLALADDHLRLVLDRAAFTRAVDDRLDEASESLVPARRGRPPRRRVSG